MVQVADIPQVMKAAVVQASKTVEVQEIPVPTIDDDEVLVQTVAIAQNPTDWKYTKFNTKPGTIIGVDYSGVVAKLGKNVKGLSIGDHVAGFVHGGNYTDRGAFAQYVKSPAELVMKFPEGTISHEQAATLGCGLWTAVQSLYQRHGLVEPPEKTTKDEWVFVYGGSTSVGMYAIQLAHASGYKVATVASPRNHDLLRSYGADYVVDYKDPEAISKIKEVTNDSIHVGLDTIAEGLPQEFSIKTFGKGPGKLVVILQPNPEAQKLREDISIQATLLYTALGREFTLGRLFPASPEDRRYIAGFIPKITDLIKSGAVVPNPIKFFEGGLAAVPKGFEYMIAGNISGEKIVYRV